MMTTTSIFVLYICLYLIKLESWEFLVDIDLDRIGLKFKGTSLNIPRGYFRMHVEQLFLLALFFNQEGVPSFSKYSVGL